MSRARPSLAEVAALGVLFAAVGIAIVATYARIPTDELYHVGDTGLHGGLGRALVYVNFPVALAAVVVLPLIADRLLSSSSDRLLQGGAALLAAVLCVVVGVPGVVDQADLDAKPVNAVPAAGVLLVIALGVIAVRRGGLGAVRPFERLDWARVGVAAVLLVAAVPWICAELGFYASDLPLVGRLFLAGQLRPNPGGTEHTLRAVHLGHHHGMDGTLLALTALAVSRAVPDVQSPRLRRAAAVVVSAAFAYGVLNAANDFWFEQVVKRGWVDTSLPSFLRPGLTWGFAILLVAAGAAYALVFRRLERVRPR